MDNARFWTGPGFREDVLQLDQDRNESEPDPPGCGQPAQSEIAAHHCGGNSHQDASREQVDNHGDQRGQTTANCSPAAAPAAASRLSEVNSVCPPHAVANPPASRLA